MNKVGTQHILGRAVTGVLLCGLIIAAMLPLLPKILKGRDFIELPTGPA